MPQDDCSSSETSDASTSETNQANKPGSGQPNQPGPSQSLNGVNNSLPGSSGGKNEPKSKPAGGSPSPKGKEKKKVAQLVVIAIIVVLCVGLIGGIGVYFLKKYRSQIFGPESSNDLEDSRNRGAGNLKMNESQQSIASTSTNGMGAEMDTDDLSHRGKPKVELQTDAANRRQRGGTNMTFDQDM